MREGEREVQSGDMLTWIGSQSRPTSKGPLRSNNVFTDLVNQCTLINKEREEQQQQRALYMYKRQLRCALS